MTTTSDPRKARITEITERTERQARLIAAHGTPENISGDSALALARTSRIPLDPVVTADDVHAFIYRDAEAAEGWGEANRVHNGIPTLARVPLPDGRVVGILDLRPALRRAREEA
jgi:hypothetical protein